MDERRELSTADLAGAVEVHDRPVKEDARAQAPRGEADNRRPQVTQDATNMGVARTSAGPRGEEAESSRGVLFSNVEAERMRSEWAEVQTAFVDAPRDAVQRADQLVAGTMKRIAEGFAEERRNLEQQWDRGDNVTTEDLRVALQRYRAFFDRLLSL